MNEVRDLSGLCHIYVEEKRAQTEISRAFELGFDFVAAQGTGTDWGPYYLGNSSSRMLNRIQFKAQAKTIISAALKNKVPFIISTGIPTGKDTHLQEALSIVNDMAKENGLTFKAAVVHGELDKQYLIDKLQSGVKMPRVVDSEYLPEYLDIKDVEKAESIVAQMGPEPIMRALDLGVDGVITGRALDVALHTALPLKLGFDPGLAAHMAKTLECGGFALGDEDPAHFAWGSLKKDHFLIRSLNNELKCTVKSVVGHALYERRDPFREENPGGYLDLTGAQFEQVDEYTVKVWGSKWVPVEPYAIKVEGACLVGYRTVTIAGIREPLLIKHLDDFLKKVRQEVAQAPILKSVQPDKDYTLVFRVYGKNAVLGDLEPSKRVPHEVGLVVDVLAKNEDLADQIVQLAWMRIGFDDYPGRITTAGNFATPYSHHAFRAGPDYRFNVWHLLPLKEPSEPFRTEVCKFPFTK